MESFGSNIIGNFNYTSMHTTVGVFSTHADAENALAELRAFGSKEEDISYIYINTKGEVVDDQVDEKVEQGTVTGVTTGAVVGAVLGFAVANGVLPGIGSLFVAGPLAAALGFGAVATTTISGAVTGAAAGGLVGAFSGIGISDGDASRFEQYIKSGDVIIVVRSVSPAVKEVFAKARAREIEEYVS